MEKYALPDAIVAQMLRSNTEFIKPSPPLSQYSTVFVNVYAMYVVVGNVSSSNKSKANTTDDSTLLLCTCNCHYPLAYHKSELPSDRFTHLLYLMSTVFNKDIVSKIDLFLVFANDPYFCVCQ